MRALVTGAAGFVGSHVVRALRQEGHEVTGTALTVEDAVRSEAKGLAPCDVRDASAVEAIVRNTRPTHVFHLAAQSSAALSWRDPHLTYEVNVTGTHHLLDAVRRHSPEARVLVAATSDEYGIVDPESCPIDESAPLRPVSPYAASKVAEEWVGRMFHEAFGLQVVVTRAFMHIGPGQPPSFATADWARQIARAELGLQAPRVSVGNLELAREFGDVRDVTAAYMAVIDAGVAGEAYNVATGEPHKLREALDVLTCRASVDIDVVVDPAKIRPADPPLLTGSSAKLERLTGWKPVHRFEDTLSAVLDYWRAQAGSQQEARGS